MLGLWIFALFDLKGCHIWNVGAAAAVLWQTANATEIVLIGMARLLTPPVATVVFDASGACAETLHDIVGTEFVGEAAISARKARIALTVAVKAVAILAAVNGAVHEGAGVDNGAADEAQGRCCYRRKLHGQILKVVAVVEEC